MSARISLSTCSLFTRPTLLTACCALTLHAGCHVAYDVGQQSSDGGLPDDQDGAVSPENKQDTAACSHRTSELGPAVELARQRGYRTPAARDAIPRNAGRRSPPAPPC